MSNTFAETNTGDTNTNHSSSDSSAPGGGNTVFTDNDGVKAYVFTNSNDNIFVPTQSLGLYTEGLDGNDNITGGSESDNINGNLGDDSINGGGGNDGDRTLSLPAGSIRVALRGGKGADHIDGGDGDDLLNGNQDNDNIIGGIGNDISRGGKGDDILTGGLGDDFLIGDAGKDQLTGNEGVDTFVLEGSATATTSQSSADVITDFLTGTDRIMLPGNTTFGQLQLNAVSTQVNGGAAVTSTAIQMGTTVFAIVQGVTPDQLTSGNFILDDKNIVSLG
jgi:Ca2+-binding RTX toxin-like protein